MKGRFNQRYVCFVGTICGRTRGRHGPTDEAYCDIKDPVCDIIMAGAEAWATQVDRQ